MSDFSKIMEKGKEYVKKGVERVSEHVDVLSLEVALRENKTILEALYATYGKSCYEGCEDETTRLKISEKLEDIEQLEESIKEAKDSIEQTKKSKPDTIFCSKCGAKSDIEDSFCSKCGEKLKK